MPFGVFVLFCRLISLLIKTILTLGKNNQFHTGPGANVQLPDWETFLGGSETNTARLPGIPSYSGMSFVSHCAIPEALGEYNFYVLESLKSYKVLL